MGGGDINLYRYAAGNPINYTDPEGLFVVSGTIVVGYAAYQAVGAIAAPIVAGAILSGGAWAWQAWNENTSDEGDTEENKECEEGGPIYVDPDGNAIPTPQGGTITGSPDGGYIQGRDSDGNETGVRKDGPHNPNTHDDPRALRPHGHVPGITNPDGTPWLPIK